MEPRPRQGNSLVDAKRPDEGQRSGNFRPRGWPLHQVSQYLGLLATISRFTGSAYIAFQCMRQIAGHARALLKQHPSPRGNGHALPGLRPLKGRSRFANDGSFGPQAGEGSFPNTRHLPRNLLPEISSLAASAADAANSPADFIPFPRTTLRITIQPAQHHVILCAVEASCSPQLSPLM
jgi:hypothetical protein